MRTEVTLFAERILLSRIRYTHVALLTCELGLWYRWYWAEMFPVGFPEASEIQGGLRHIVHDK